MFRLTVLFLEKTFRYHLKSFFWKQERIVMLQKEVAELRATLSLTEEIVGETKEATEKLFEILQCEEPILKTGKFYSFINSD